MKITLLSILVLLLCQLTVLNSYTKDFRSITITFKRILEEDIMFHFDPAVISFQRTAAIICESFPCQPQNSSVLADHARKLYVDKLYLSKDSCLYRYQSEYLNVAAEEWLSIADEKALDSLHQLHQETTLLFEGHYKQVENPVVNQFLLKNFYPDDDVVFWTSLAGDLFNQQQYEQAEAIGYFILFKLCQNNPNCQYHGAKVLMMLSEVSRELQRWDLGATFGALAIQWFSESSRDLQTIPRLRLLLTIPSIPDAYDVAVTNRSDLLRDLIEFTNEVSNTGITISLELLLGEVAGTPFHLAHQGLNDRAFQEVYSNALTALCPDLAFFGLNGSGTVQSDGGISTRIVKLGLVSSNFCDHSIGKILISTIMALAENPLWDVNGRKLLIDLHVYQVSSSPVQRGDIIFHYLNESLGLRFHHLSSDVASTRERLARDSLDFLLFADLGMDPVTYFLAHSRVAVFQAAWWGHPVTSGIPSIDFFFGLDVEVQEAQSYYSEQLVRMEFMSSAPLLKAESPENSSEILRSLGFSDDARIGLVLGRLFKVHPAFDEVVVDLLMEFEDAGLSQAYVVFIAERHPSWNAIIFNRIAARLKSKRQNWRHLIQKLRFISYSNYVKAVLVATVVLDTFPYGGCLTTHDALSNGVPVVTLPLENVSGRHTLAMYRQMRMTGLVARDAQDFVQITLSLLKNLTLRNEFSTEIVAKYTTQFHRPLDVITEWVKFLHQLFHD